MSEAVRAREALQQYFGFTDFREGQEEVIGSVLAGHNTVVVMPTGGGKSLCYQLPALMGGGITLVVSPLIALMKDQVDQLAERGVACTFINSSLSYAETNIRLSRLRMGEYKLVYVAPERFRSGAFMDSIAETRVRLFAVDEAHCISHWGHDFRPDYLRMKAAIERLGNPQVIALTATATPQVRADIREQLGLANAQVFVAGFDRPNLALRVAHPASEREKLEILKRVIRNSQGSGIIYAATRKSVEQIASRLKLDGMRVELYHGGMDDAERSRAQDSFMRGSAQAIVATNAFGMGIDKADIRFVAHFHLPGSIEAYYQEIGRAGRDGLPSTCLLLFNYADTRTQQFFIDGGHPSADLIRRVYGEIASLGLERVELSTRELAGRLGVKNDMSIQSSLLILEKAGHIERGRAGETTVLASMKTTIDAALGAVSDDSNEGAVLRDLIFTRNLNEREQTDLELRSIAAQLGMSDAQMRRAMAALAAKGLISYHATFQGRGIRVLDTPPAKELRIDTREMAVRAAAEQWKLRRMLDYCYHKACLRKFILGYFGDRKAAPACDSCSSCAPAALRYLEDSRIEAHSQGALRVSRRAGAVVGRPQAVVSAPSELERFIIEEAPSGVELREQLKARAASRRALLDSESPSSGLSGGPTARAQKLNQAQTTVVIKILSCIARIEKEYGPSRFGKGTVAAVLRGSAGKQVIESKLDKLSTYGLLREMRQDDITGYIKALIGAGCIKVEKGLYPTVSLTEFGREVMRSRAEVMLELPA